MRTIADQWASYERAVLPKDASAIQRRECKRAFYAGAQAVLGMQFDIANLSEDAGVACLDGLLAEGEQFCRDVLAGIA